MEFSDHADLFFLFIGSKGLNLLKMVHIWNYFLFIFTSYCTDVLTLTARGCYYFFLNKICVGTADATENPTEAENSEPKEVSASKAPRPQGRSISLLGYFFYYYFGDLHGTYVLFSKIRYKKREWAKRVTGYTEKDLQGILGSVCPFVSSLLYVNSLLGMVYLTVSVDVSIFSQNEFMIIITFTGKQGRRRWTKESWFGLWSIGYGSYWSQGWPGSR